MTKGTFRESLPDDIEELKDIIEIQLANIKVHLKESKELNKKFKLFNTSPFTSVDFLHRPPPDIQEEYD